MEATDRVFVPRKKIPYDELEDKYLKLRDSHLRLKKKYNEQEEDIKKLATKLSRLQADLRKQDGALDGSYVRDVDAEIRIQELERQLREEREKSDTLQKSVAQYRQRSSELTQRLRVTQRQVRVQGMGRGHVDENTPVDMMDRLARELRVNTKPDERWTQLISMLRKKLLEMGDEMKVRDDELKELRTRVMESESHAQRTQNDAKQVEDEVRKSVDADMKQYENVTDIITLQRELREKLARLALLQTRFQSADSQLARLKKNHEKLLEQTEALNDQLKVERKQNIAVNSELKIAQLKQRKVNELESIIADYGSEIQILKEENESLREVASSSSAANVKELHEKHEQQHESDRKKIDDLEAEVDALTSVKDDLEDKLRLFTEDGGLDPSDMEALFAVIKQREEEGDDIVSRIHGDDRLREEVSVLRARNADLEEEIERTKQLMFGMAKEKEALQGRLQVSQKQKAEAEAAAAKAAAKAAQATPVRSPKPSESPKKKVVQKKPQPQPEDDTISVTDSQISEISLHPEVEDNVIMVHLGELTLSSTKGLSSLSVCAAFDFYDHETQYSPVITVQQSSPRSPRSKSSYLEDFDFTAYFRTLVDDVLLCYLGRYYLLVDLYAVTGTKTSRFGTAAVSLQSLLTNQLKDELSVEPKAVAVTATVYDTSGKDMPERLLSQRVIGTLHCGLRAKLPFNRLSSELEDALVTKDLVQLPPISEIPSNNGQFKELVMKLHSISVDANEDDPLYVPQLFGHYSYVGNVEANYAHTTSICPKAALNAQFPNDCQRFPYTPLFHRLLSQTKLQIYALDYKASSGASSSSIYENGFIGVAEIDPRKFLQAVYSSLRNSVGSNLVTLPVALKGTNGREVGFVELEVYWESRAVGSATRTPRPTSIAVGSTVQSSTSMRSEGSRAVRSLDEELGVHQLSNSQNESAGGEESVHAAAEEDGVDDFEEEEDDAFVPMKSDSPPDMGSGRWRDDGEGDDYGLSDDELFNDILQDR